MLLTAAALWLGLATGGRSAVGMRCALVTGATDGIGRHTASQLARASPGLRLLLHGRDAERLREARRRVLELAPATRVELLQSDLSDPAQVRSLAVQVRSLTDELEVFVQNAGAFLTEPDWTSEGLERTFAVNVAAPFLLAAELFPLL